MTSGGVVGGSGTRMQGTATPSKYIAEHHATFFRPELSHQKRRNQSAWTTIEMNFQKDGATTMAGVGKRVVDELYVHLSAVDELANEEHRQAVACAVALLPADVSPAPCVAKLNLKSARVALLAYPGFEDEPFPRLTASWGVRSREPATLVLRSYEDSLNPPILHRKELLVSAGHPRREQWRKLTKAAEGLGLFDDTTTIGFKLNWDRLIAAKGYQLQGDALVPLGNNLTSDTVDTALPDETIYRHLTALHRSALSAPMQLLIRHGLVTRDTSVFDYGCGRGGDIEGLRSSDISASGWDPHYASDQPITSADVVNLGFVINVIEDSGERVDALQAAFRLAKNVLAVSVMLYPTEPAGKQFRDGYLTSRNTFQKYFSQGEFKEYLEHTLHREPFMVGPGIAFVFANEDAEQRFSSGRYRTKGIASRLIATKRIRVQAAAPVQRSSGGLRPPPPQKKQTRVREERTPKISKAATELARARPLLESLWHRALELGRQPEEDEISCLPEIRELLGSYGRGWRQLTKLYDLGLLESAAKLRRDDLQLFMAVQAFSKRRAYQQLEQRLQRDIKAFFGDYRTAQGEGVRLLLQASDSSEVLEACKAAARNGLGWLEEEHSLQLHVSLVERLPVVLRAYVACGLILWDSLSDVDIVKIHITSRKLTFLEFYDFDESPVPELKRRIKINIRTQDYSLFEYGQGKIERSWLYYKSRYLHEELPKFAEQVAFDETLEATGALAETDSAPPLSYVSDYLERKRLRIDGMRITASDRIPDLDEHCGAIFTFRDFVECGETQKRLGIHNVPLRPATYNALYRIAEEVLEPIVEYFGGIQLTYGVCSAELGRHIHRRIAPKLDQHASYEVNSRNQLICHRGGAACDFLIVDENMREVALWIMRNLPYDRLYYYGPDKPLHVSYSEAPAGEAFEMVLTSNGRLIPRTLRLSCAAEHTKPEASAGSS